MTNGLYGRCLHDLNPNDCNWCVQNQKLRVLIEERIRLLNQLVENKKKQNEPYKWVSDIIGVLQKLVEDCKK